ncbi:MAG: hypothetical protein A2Z21_09440 [Candidatus Fraserbacteria bacterium RBG_16_55_9]|uniref:Uncharacterized protein n=1 Tax=Fraserbacteria sp. (strain RBG_16_55_9) TaxID=1817864 RepID=A0A1F5UNT6_FRAXR|nr:MAG: hypothetical protein A2Z21_09440 [Candidatus Fraserbacteria bacterium RBG_16_55_9]
MGKAKVRHMTAWLVRIWFKGLLGNQEIRLRGSVPEYLIFVGSHKDWTYLASRGKMLARFHAALERSEVVMV